MNTGRLLPVRTLVARRVDTVEVARAYTGQIVPRRRSSLSFELAGRLDGIAVDDGQHVEAGAILARLDVARLDVQRAGLLAQREAASAVLDEMIAGPRAQDIAVARASVDERQAHLNFWRRERQRLERLIAEEHAHPKEYDDSVSREAMAAAQVEAARQTLNELLEGTREEQVRAQRARVAQLDASVRGVDVDLEKSVLVAPFDGTIAHRLADEGTVINPGQPVLELIENSVLEARVGVPAMAASTLRVGERYSIEADGRTYDAELTAVLPELDDVTRTVTVVLTVTDDDRSGLVPNRIVRFRLPERLSRPGYWLPVDALVRGERGLWAAYALAPDSSESAWQGPSWQVERRDVEVLYTQADRVFVRGVLGPGDRIVAAGAHRIVPGQRVRAID